ncbi:helix-turn-helix domain-containing protein [Burkholderia sp. L27(2015)]|uniref:helix-turn-helix domain-containing protein n=1 Tax=Burkholderia sp. L27(2015) TaxID=1641858 RepID=UPI00131AABAB|nr:helix-turn-helix domain-containing protein [Burkholderia sp. L27(2015)]
MGNQISLDHLPAPRRFDHFRELSTLLFVPVSLRSDDPMTFRFARTEKTFGSLSFGVGKMSKLHVARTPRDVIRSESDAKIKVTMPLTGTIQVRQDRREALIRPGEFYVNDPARPYEEQFSENMTYLSVHVPKNSIPSRLGGLEHSTGLKFGADLPSSKIARDFLVSLSTVWEEISEASESHLGSIALDLIMAAISERSNRNAPQTDTYQSAQFHRAKGLIDGRLQDPTLSLSQIAAELGVSTRYISYLLHQRGMSYRNYVLAQRLLRAKNDLSDPRLANRAITTIAYSWGFSDSAHFSRTFKAAHGISPREYRAFKLSAC